MENLDELREIVEKVLLEWADFIKPRTAPPEQDNTPEVIFDRIRDRYVLFDVGWRGESRMYSLIAHLDIINGKIWIQKDNTEEGVATDLEKYGVPKDKIVLAFKSPALRKYTEYAMA
ncbi:MAG: XisI protein [Acidobacteria bacterium]|nr:XisI protein [Acidobacteriota bacterium]